MQLQSAYRTRGCGSLANRTMRLDERCVKPKEMRKTGCETLDGRTTRMGSANGGRVRDDVGEALLHVLVASLGHGRDGQERCLPVCPGGVLEHAGQDGVRCRHEGWPAWRPQSQSARARSSAWGVVRAWYRRGMGVVRAWYGRGWGGVQAGYGRGLGGREAARCFVLLSSSVHHPGVAPHPVSSPVLILKFRTDGAGEAIEALLGDERVGVLVVLNDL